MHRFAPVEREGLADALTDLGPDQPTLCEGWQTADMAAHLVLRERRPVAALGIVFKSLAGYNERAQRALRDGTPYDELVRLFRTGPPLLSPIKLAPLDEATNAVEYFVHHEDVRRGQSNWEPRDLGVELEGALWSRLRRGARLMLRHAPVGVAFDTGQGDAVVAKAGEPRVTVRGKPSELTLLAFGRGRHARIDYEGNPADVERVRSTSFGI